MNLSKNKELVSIIVVNWNGKKWLDKCLKSIINQNYKYIEIIIVDNASTDGSVEYIKKKFSKVKIVQNRYNLGLAKAVHIGVKSSHGEYLVLLNNDTWIKNNFIGKLLDFYKKNNYSVISPIVKEYNGSNVVVNLPNIDPTGSPAYFYPITRKDKLLYLSSSYFCSKKDYISTLGFDDNYFAYYEDVDWFWRLNLLDKKFSYVNDVAVYHAGAGSTGTGIKYKVFLWRNQNALQTLLKNYSLITLIMVLPVYFLQNLAEIVFFLLMLKPKIAFSYLEGWWFNIKNIKKIIKKRNWIQKRRKINDWEIIKKMYWGPAKLRMLLNYRQ